MLRAEPIGSLWSPLLILALLGLAVGTLATLRFRGYLAPAPGTRAQRKRERDRTSHGHSEPAALDGAAAPLAGWPE
jgi:hypothetical protein